MARKRATLGAGMARTCEKRLFFDDPIGVNEHCDGCPFCSADAGTINACCLMAKLTNSRFVRPRDALMELYEEQLQDAKTPYGQN